tara:strand:+ start:1125 stop:2042 length:918 start_codon:yes stop_codon:yes gene_type:complete
VDLFSDLKKAKRGAIAKTISIFENDEKESRKLIKKIYKSSGKSMIIGITGPAGTGKSSLINRMAIQLKKFGMKPAVLAIDPTSHVSGGAILGDRVRMTESTDFGTYIRSIPSRGATGAVSRSIRNSVRVLEYAGFDPIIIESVGAGQTEIGISNIADITIVMFNPHTGDSIQTIKAGITEIGDIYIVNKSDLDGASQLFQSVQEFIGNTEKKSLILKMSSKTGDGVPEFLTKLKKLMIKKKKDKKLLEKQKLTNELDDIIFNNINKKVAETLLSSKSYSLYLKKVQAKTIDPFEAADNISKSILK